MIEALANYITIEPKEKLNKLNFQQLVIDYHKDLKCLNFVMVEEVIKMLIQNLINFKNLDFVNFKILIMY